MDVLEYFLILKESRTRNSHDALLGIVEKEKPGDVDPSKHMNVVTRKAFQPITKADSQLDEELKQTEVENTHAGD